MCRSILYLSFVVSLLGCADRADRASRASRASRADRASRDVQVVEDLDGPSIDLETLIRPAALASVFLFTATDCPISNRYAPEINSLHDEYGGQGIDFWIVYVDPVESVESQRRHFVEFGYRCGALRDTHHWLVSYCGATTTPEVAVVCSSTNVAANGSVVYLGRIDDRFVDFGKSSRVAERRDLAESLADVVAGRTADRRVFTKAVGCPIPPLEP